MVVALAFSGCKQGSDELALEKRRDTACDSSTASRT